MDVERIRAFLLTLPHVVETVQWGGSLVFWAGDKAIGGKMFAVINLSANNSPERDQSTRLISYSAGPERYAELLETEGIRPAPYLARIHWVAIEHWGVFRNPEWEEQLTAAHALTLAKMPQKTRDLLALPATQQRRLIADRRKILAAKAAAKTPAKAPSPKSPPAKSKPAKSQKKATK
ncbi:MmcQ/YjbR family DNA-binding protein [Granulicella sp. L60]|uniref:MmcQ/YjbR family DNA-binding protein n=1 Tax=Granulicella sp. L60 TaxID=1641866 RepID=UPI00131A6B0C|nr:MmcQ/YjbR family DNA-binding protein [Granulicella sp. L60]